MGFSVGVIIIVTVWIAVWLKRRRCKSSSPKMFRRPPPDTLDMKSLMDGGGFTTPTYEETCGGSLLYEGGNILYDDSTPKTPLMPSFDSKSLTLLPPRECSVSTLASLRASSTSCSEYAAPIYNNLTLRIGVRTPPPPPLPSVLPPDDLPHKQQNPQILVSFE